jgi:hypothetical protein
MVKSWNWVILIVALAPLVLSHGCSGRPVGGGADGLEVHGPDSKGDTVAVDRGINKPMDCYKSGTLKHSSTKCMITFWCRNLGGYKYECTPGDGGFECTCLGLSIVEKKFKTTSACNWHLAPMTGAPCWTGILEELKTNCGWSFEFNTCPFGGK